MVMMDERERFLADTLAYVRHLADGPSLQPQVTAQSDAEHAMRSRLEAFRNRRRLLEIEREVHYQRAIQRIRIATEGAA